MGVILVRFNRAKACKVWKASVDRPRVLDSSERSGAIATCSCQYIVQCIVQTYCADLLCRSIVQTYCADLLCRSIVQTYGLFNCSMMHCWNGCAQLNSVRFWMLYSITMRLHCKMSFGGSKFGFALATKTIYSGRIQIEMRASIPLRAFNLRCNLFTARPLNRYTTLPTWRHTKPM